MPRSRYRIYERAEPHFLTCSAVAWLPLFSRPACAETVLESLRFLVAERRLVLYAYVLMEDHLHLAASSDDLVAAMQAFKSFTAREILKALRQEGSRRFLRQLAGLKAGYKTTSRHQVWQEGSHPQEILSEAMMGQKVDYIHQNPVRRGYVDAPEHWRYSSARDYIGQRGLLPVVVDW